MRTAAVRAGRVLVPALLLLGAAGWLGWKSALPQVPPNLTLHTLQGAALPLADLRGKVVMVTFWATSCEICLREMPELVRMHEELGPRGLTLIAVAMPYDPAWLVAQYATTRRLPFGVALDLEGEAVQGFGGVEGTPTAFLLDKQGRVVERIVGAPDFARLRKRIEAELGARG